MKISRNYIVKELSGKKIYLLLTGTMLSMCMNIAVVLGTGIIAEHIDGFVRDGRTDVNRVLIPVLICITVGTVTAYYKNYFSGMYSITAVKEINDYAIDKLPGIEYPFFEREGIGKIITKLISDIGEIEHYYESTLPELINNIISAILVLIYVGIKDITLMITSLCLYPIVLIVTYFFGVKLKKLADKRRGKIDVMVERVTDSIEGIEVVRSFGLYDRFVKYIYDAIQDILDNEYTRAWIIHFSQTVNRILFWIPNLLCPCIAMVMVINGKMTIGAMMAYIVLVNKVIGGVKAMPFLLNGRREAQISIGRVEKIFEEKEEALDRENYGKDNYNSKNDGGLAGRNGNIAVEFREVSFSYDTSDDMAKSRVLKEMSFSIPTGKTIAFVGESGQGKSTIFKILCGFYEISGGDILLGGENVSGTGLANARNMLSVVEQEPFLFEGTIAENIAVGSSSADEKQIRNAAEAAGIHDFIMQLPQKYDTVIGEKGAGLSGGEKQRIAIARALIKDTPILLMDEPTSSVDVNTEQIICETIENLRRKKTVLIISHRLSAIQNADCIMVVQDGRISESGSHEKLIRLNGFYKKLYELEQNSL